MLPEEVFYELWCEAFFTKFLSFIHLWRYAMFLICQIRYYLWSKRIHLAHCTCWLPEGRGYCPSQYILQFSNKQRIVQWSLHIAHCPRLSWSSPILDMVLLGFDLKRCSLNNRCWLPLSRRIVGSYTYCSSSTHRTGAYCYCLDLVSAHLILALRIATRANTLWSHWTILSMVIDLSSLLLRKARRNHKYLNTLQIILFSPLLLWGQKFFTAYWKDHYCFVDNPAGDVGSTNVLPMSHRRPVLSVHINIAV